MPLTPPERACLRALVLARCRDWAGFHAALRAQTQLTLGQSSLDRFFSGRSNSPRTLRTLAQFFRTTPDALVRQVEIAAALNFTAEGSRRSNQVSSLDDPEAFRIAYQLWVEITTRKLGLPINPDEDLLTEIYDSWYAFFRAARELAKEIPLHEKRRSPAVRQLVYLAVALLNEGVRPHLQRWQAHFRQWNALGGDRALAEGLTPQKAQQLFPEWQSLCDDLLAANQRVIGYLATLEAMLGMPHASTLDQAPRVSKLIPPKRGTKTGGKQ